MGYFVLKDNLRHRAYTFPKTVLNFHKTGDKPDEKNDVLYVNGVKTPYEILPEKDGYILKTIADLPYDSERSFTFKKGENNYKPLGNDNGIIAVESIKGGLYSVASSFGAKFAYSIETELKKLSETEENLGGAVESIFIKTLKFAGGKEYKFTLKLKRDLDYLEIYEEMKGFCENEAKLVISWQNFEPLQRYTTYRGKEKIDDYTDENGKMPFVINPFMPCNSAWDRPMLAYTAEGGEWSGILLHDYKNFDDGEYAIWGSHDTLALIPYENKIEARIKQGKRAFMHVLSNSRAVEELETHYARYYSAACLDKVKDYVLDWEDDKNEYPKYFSVKKDTKWGGFYGDFIGKPAAEDMMNILDRDSTIFTKPEFVAPVSCRAFRSTWAQVFDLTARELTDDEFKRVRAAMAFICYTYADETHYPIENMLAGHPNFLTDVLGTVAVFAALLGKKHPMHDKWLAYYEKGIARNFKYHIRPAVEKWQAEGGRWTENVGCYLFAMLTPVVNDCHLIYALSGEIPMLYPHIKPLLKYLVNIVSPENEYGRRLYPSMGAHAATGEFGGEFGHGFILSMIKLADMLKYYEPLVSEYIIHNFRNAADFEGVLAAEGIYGESYRKFAKYNNGTSPEIYSCKYTGFGFVLRDHENTNGESQVILQQIDDGPNYRWGRTAQGGCGEIYYYANRKKYTDHNPEDVGDETRGDVQSATNFGVLIDREYRSVGRNDLTEPLMDFGFVKYARVNAGKYSAPYYKYRSLMMVENRYVVIYDAVADKFQAGRFVWAQKGTGEFPTVKNIRPGVNGVLSDGGTPVDKLSDYKKNDTKTLNFDGRGDFLTVVTHLRGYNDERAIYSIDKKDYGAELVFPQNREEVFFDNARICEENEEFSFDGYVGYFTKVKSETRLAIFNGKKIGCKEITIEIPYDKKNRHGMSAVLCENEIRGKVDFANNGKVKIQSANCGEVYIDGEKADYTYENGGYIFEMPKGKHSYNIGKIADVEKSKIVVAVVRNGGFTLEWQRLKTAESYEISISDDGEYIYKSIGKTNENSFNVDRLENGKYHVRVRGITAEKFGEWSHAYPVYVTGEKPHYPDGLRVVKNGNKYVATWGEVLGCGEYRLYKVGSKTPIYAGKERQAEVNIGEYFVTAVNGNGESEPSLIRSAKCELAEWDNHPEKGFVRDPRSNEHGYAGFDFIGNKKLKNLTYGEQKC